jgi:hypothetical protein
MREEAKKRLAIFLPLTFAFSGIFHLLIARAGTMQVGGGLYVAGLMWSPGVAALLTQLVNQGNLRGLGWRWGKARCQLLSIALPFPLVSATYGFGWPVRRLGFAVGNAMQTLVFLLPHLLLLLVSSSLWPIIAVQLLAGWLLHPSDSILPGWRTV